MPTATALRDAKTCCRPDARRQGLHKHLGKAALAWMPRPRGRPQSEQGSGHREEGCARPMPGGHRHARPTPRGDGARGAPCRPLNRWPDCPDEPVPPGCRLPAWPQSKCPGHWPTQSRPRGDHAHQSLRDADRRELFGVRGKFAMAATGQKQRLDGAAEFAR